MSEYFINIFSVVPLPQMLQQKSIETEVFACG